MIGMNHRKVDNVFPRDDYYIVYDINLAWVNNYRLRMNYDVYYASHNCLHIVCCGIPHINRKLFIIEYDYPCRRRLENPTNTFYKKPWHCEAVFFNKLVNLMKDIIPEVKNQHNISYADIIRHPLYKAFIATKIES